MRKTTQRRRAAMPNGVRHARRPTESLLDRAYDKIKFQIITCRYRPGEVLNEAAIAGKLKIGRTPVHQAIHRLMQDGFVSIIPRKGVMVRPVSMDEALETIGVRLVTECYCVRLAAGRADESDLDRLEAIVEEAEQVVATGGVERLMLLDRKFHDALANAAKNVILGEVLRKLHERSLRLWFISLRDPDHHRRVVAEHRLIVDTLRTRQPEAVENAMREHILSFERNLTR